MTDAELEELSQALPWDEPDAERVERLRTALIASLPAQPTSKQSAASQDAATLKGPAARKSGVEHAQPRWRYLWLAAALASCVLGVLLWPKPVTRSASAAYIEPSAAAQFSRLGTATDEVIRLTDGVLSVKVKHLEAGQRFRVVTTDAEVEVRGTEFSVEAAGGELRAVKVVHGRVEVRRDGRTTLLVAGQSWSAGEQSAAGVTDAAAPSAVPANAAPVAAPSDAPKPPLASPAAATTAAQAGAGVGRKPNAPGASAAKTPQGAESDAKSAATAPGVEAPEEAAFREGYAALRDGDPNRAEAAFSKSAKAGPLAEDASFWRAVSLMRAGRKQAATQAFQEFLQRYPKSVRRAEAEQMLGKLQGGAGE